VNQPSFKRCAMLCCGENNRGKRMTQVIAESSGKWVVGHKRRVFLIRLIQSQVGNSTSSPGTPVEPRG
jgi:hypothetical protein